MIEYLTGTILARLPHSVIINVNGVGYGVEMPLSALCEMPPQGELVSIWIDTYVREDALKLYGFLTFDDRQAFGLLRSVSGIGPRIALAILSTLNAKSLRQTVLSNRLEVLEAVPGIGKRTAEKLILELRPKMEKFSLVSPQILKGASYTKPSSANVLDPLAAFDELEDSLFVQSSMDMHVSDLRSALENLGYKEKEISPVIANIRHEFSAVTGSIEFQSVLKSALKSLRAGN